MQQSCSKRTKSPMDQSLKFKNWIVEDNPSKLHQIDNTEINIAIQNRDIAHLSDEIDTLLNNGVEIRFKGDAQSIVKDIENELEEYPLIKNDVISLLNLFKEITKSNGYRILLATINSNMCRKFHTDINDLRMLCTYKGPGTLWLSENNINRKALESRCENNNIVLDENKIKQAKTGSVVLLKGALYPKEGTNAIVHRSPTIEESGKKRLLLRIDTNEFLNFLQ